MEATISEGSVQPTAWESNPECQTSAWGQKAEVAPCSLEDVMSEQLASELQQTEDVLPGASQQEGTEVDPDIQALIEASSFGTDTSSDVALARMLQIQFDKEHNEMLKLEENKYNGKNKVTISFDNYKSSHPHFLEDNDDEDDEEENIESMEKAKTQWEEPLPKFNGQGIAGKGKNITTKHDKVLCGRKNASKMMEFPPEFLSGDGEGMDMQLPNHVYNKLKRHSDAENRRNQRLHEKKEHSTAEHAMDPRIPQEH